jgi:hypothetical protein
VSVGKVGFPALRRFLAQGAICSTTRLKAHRPNRLDQSSIRGQLSMRACYISCPVIRRAQRTEWNVFCSDATVIFHVPEHDGDDPGTLWTAKFAARFGRPCFLYDPRTPTAVPEIIRWLADVERAQGRPVRWLKVAGPSERQLSAKFGDGECDHVLNATRIVIIKVVPELANPVARDQAKLGRYRRAKSLVANW